MHRYFFKVTFLSRWRIKCHRKLGWCVCPLTTYTSSKTMADAPPSPLQTPAMPIYMALAYSLKHVPQDNSPKSIKFKGLQCWSFRWKVHRWRTGTPSKAKDLPKLAYVILLTEGRNMRYFVESKLNTSPMSTMRWVTNPKQTNNTSNNDLCSTTP